MFCFESPVGLIAVRSDGEAVTELDLCSDDQDQYSLSATNAIEEQVADELRQYFKSPQLPFTVPIKPSGTPFCHRVWQQLMRTAAGERLTYKALAGKIDSHPRPVGNACRANPILIIIPCHRVIPSCASADEVGNYRGQNTQEASSIKAWLLNHEAGTTSTHRTQGIGRGRRL